MLTKTGDLSNRFIIGGMIAITAVAIGYALFLARCHLPTIEKIESPTSGQEHGR